MAEPDVQTIIVGSCNCWAMPMAKNAAQRSSTTLYVLKKGSKAKLIVNGAFLEPGEITTCLIPAFLAKPTILCAKGIDEIG